MFLETSWIGPVILVLFVLAYALVFAEEKLHLRKSKPVMIAAGLIWILVALLYQQQGRGAEVPVKLRHILVEYAELFLFLLSAMSFVNTMVERNVFESLRSRLTASKLSLRGLYWATGTFAFFLSPIADNLTTALVMGTVVMSTMGHNKKAVIGGLISVVVAANAGGAFSPFGDITTLMIWQKGVVQFGEFFALFLPSFANWFVPALIISFSLPNEKLKAETAIEPVYKGGYVVVGLFLATIAVTVFLDHTLLLPPFLGMMMGLGVLNLYGHFLNRSEQNEMDKTSIVSTVATKITTLWPMRKPFDIFGILEKLEWDTLLFFYGILLCVGGLGVIGYLDAFSTFLYSGYGPTIANTLCGLISSVIGNIPLTFAIITMNPPMDLTQWLLATLTVGTGASLLSIGSAAGVALMGIARGTYTFSAHLKWSWAILLGYAASIVLHLALNG